VEEISKKKERAEAALVVGGKKEKEEKSCTLFGRKKNGWRLTSRTHSGTCTGIKWVNRTDLNVNS